MGLEHCKRITDLGLAGNPLHDFSELKRLEELPGRYSRLAYYTRPSHDTLTHPIRPTTHALNLATLCMISLSSELKRLEELPGRYSRWAYYARASHDTFTHPYRSTTHALNLSHALITLSFT